MPGMQVLCDAGAFSSAPAHEYAPGLSCGPENRAQCPLSSLHGHHSSQSPPSICAFLICIISFNP